MCAQAKARVIAEVQQVRAPKESRRLAEIEHLMQQKQARPSPHRCADPGRLLKDSVGLLAGMCGILAGC